jgi:hypothetical protein
MLLQDYPVALELSAEGWSSYHTGIFSCSSRATIDHAVELVGYTSTYWIIKNQWSSSWGKQGFIWVTRSRVNLYTNCFIGERVIVYWGTSFEVGLFVGFLIVLLFMV